MFQYIPLGTYFPGDSLLHHLRARTKLLVMLWLTIFFFIANQRFWHFAPHTAAVLLLLGEPVSCALDEFGEVPEMDHAGDIGGVLARERQGAGP